MEQIALIYIGKKPFKKDTVTGSGTIFPQGKPVPVAADIAYRLLKHPTVWINAANQQEYQERLAREEEEQLRIQSELVALEKFELEKRDMTCGEYGDLGKMTGAQLKTLVEGAELDIAPMAAQEKVDEFRLRVRDALRAKIAVEHQEGEGE